MPHRLIAADLGDRIVLVTHACARHPRRSNGCDILQTPAHCGLSDPSRTLNFRPPFSIIDLHLAPTQHPHHASLHMRCDLPAQQGKGIQEGADSVVPASVQTARPSDYIRKTICSVCLKSNCWPRLCGIITACNATGWT